MRLCRMKHCKRRCCQGGHCRGNIVPWDSDAKGDINGRDFVEGNSALSVSFDGNVTVAEIAWRDICFEITLGDDMPCNSNARGEILWGR